MEKTKPSIQTDAGKVLVILQDNQDWVCGTHFQQGNNRFQKFIPTYAQRVSDLNKLGYEISSQKCIMHAHRGNVAMYRIKLNEPRQERLAI